MRLSKLAVLCLLFNPLSVYAANCGPVVTGVVAEMRAQQSYTQRELTILREAAERACLSASSSAAATSAPRAQASEAEVDRSDETLYERLEQIFTDEPERNEGHERLRKRQRF